MKKLFFTAIILVAFSSVSMANTIFLNEPSHIENKTNVKDKPTMEFLPYCTIVFLQTYATFVNLDLEEEALGEAQAAYSECMAGK